MLDIIVVDLSRDDVSECNNIKVVRVFSEKLVQINFGYHSAHFGYPMLEGKVHSDSITWPHYFA